MTGFAEFAWLAGFIALLAADWLQTRTIARNPDRWTETNPILGPHPSVGRVNVYFGVVALLSIAAAFALPAAIAIGVFGAGIGVQAPVVWRNHRLGIRPDRADA